MKNILQQIIFGKDNRFNGILAIMVVGAIALGCTCLKDLNKPTQPTQSTPIIPTNQGTAPTPNKEPAYTKADASKKEIPSDPEIQDMIRNTVLDFNSAVKTQDFTDLHAKSSKVFQRAYTPAKLKETFQEFINGQMDISSISSMTARITSPPKLENRLGLNIFSVSGEYPTAGVTTTFDLQYVAEGKDWKLLLMKIYAPIKRR